MSYRAVFVLNGLILLGMLAALALGGFGWRTLEETPGFGLVLIGLGLAGAVGAAVLLVLPVAARVNVVLLGTSTVLTLWVASWLLYDPSPADSVHMQRQEAARAAGVAFDARSMREVVEDLRRRGIEAYPALVGGPYSNDPRVAHADPTTRPPLPLAGRSRTTTVVCNEGGEYFIFESDRFGFNNPDSVYNSPSTALILGDSFAFGNCVPNTDHVAGRLRGNGVAVVNLGYRGTGPLIQLAQLREFGQIVQPDIVLWMFYSGNDLQNLESEFESATLRRYLDPDYTQNLVDRQDEVDALWADFVEQHLAESEEESEAASLSDALPAVLSLRPLRRRIGFTRSSGDGEAPRFEEIVRQLQAEVERLDAKLYFIYIPTYGDFLIGGSSPREYVLDAVHANGVPVIDFESRLRATGDPLSYYPFRLPGHFTAEGYGLLAEQILEEVPMLGSPGVEVNGSPLSGAVPEATTEPTATNAIGTGEAPAAN